MKVISTAIQSVASQLMSAYLREIQEARINGNNELADTLLNQSDRIADIVAGETITAISTLQDENGLPVPLDIKEIPEQYKVNVSVTGARFRVEDFVKRYFERYPANPYETRAFTPGAIGAPKDEVVTATITRAKSAD